MAKTNDTLRELSAFNQYYIGDVLTKIHLTVRDSENTKGKRLEDLTYEEISNNTDLKLLIEQILNGVDYLCIGVYKGVFREDLLDKVLNEKINYVWNTFQNFVKGRREKNNSNTWNAIESFIKRNNETR